jgi:hypothetical protein
VRAPALPILFVPGAPASELLHAEEGHRLFFRFRDLDSTQWRRDNLDLLMGPDDPDDPGPVTVGPAIKRYFQGETLLDLAHGKQSSSFYDLMEGVGYPKLHEIVREAPWDWRLPVDHPSTLRGLRGAIDSLHEETGRRVAVVAHGAGGLAVRAALESEPECVEAIDRLVAIGVPWAGTPDVMGWLGYHHKLLPLDKKTTDRVVTTWWSFWDLAPPDPDSSSLEDEEGPLALFTVEGRPASPLTSTRWIGTKKDAFKRLRAESAHERLGARGRELRLKGRSLAVWNLVGWGAPTIPSARLEGKEIQLDEPTPDGDGIVPRRSAAWLAGDGVRTFFVPLGGFQPVPHGTLWKARAVREIFRRIVEEDDGSFEHVFAAVDSHDSDEDTASVRVRLVAQDENGAGLERAEVRVLDREEWVPFDEDGRLTIHIHRYRWRHTRADVRQVRARVRWQQQGHERQKDFRLLAEGNPHRK